VDNAGGAVGAAPGAAGRRPWSLVGRLLQSGFRGPGTTAVVELEPGPIVPRPADPFPEAPKRPSAARPLSLPFFVRLGQPSRASRFFPRVSVGGPRRASSPARARLGRAGTIVPQKLMAAIKRSGTKAVQGSSRLGRLLSGARRQKAPEAVVVGDPGGTKLADSSRESGKKLSGKQRSMSVFGAVDVQASKHSLKAMEEIEQEPEEASSSSSSSSSADGPRIRERDHVRVVKTAGGRLNPGKYGEVAQLYGEVAWVRFWDSSRAVPVRLLTAARGRKKNPPRPPRPRGELERAGSRAWTLAVADGVATPMEELGEQTDAAEQPQQAEDEEAEVAAWMGRRRQSVNRTLAIGQLVNKERRMKDDPVFDSRAVKEFEGVMAEWKKKQVGRLKCVPEEKADLADQVFGVLMDKTAEFQQRDVSGATPAGAWKLHWSCTAGSKGDGSNKCPNQDAFSMTRGGDGELIIVVADGHGEDGHHVACRVARTIPALLLDTEGDHQPEKFSEQWFASAFTLCEQDVEAFAMVHDLNLTASGATCAVAVLVPDPGGSGDWGQLYMAHVGDTRITLYSSQGEELCRSIDHSLDDYTEQQRILDAGGEIREISGHKRVFRAGKSVPGLGMARSFGDVSVKDCGVTEDCTVVGPVAVPVGSRVMVASDGVWDKMDSDDVASMQRQGDKLEDQEIATGDIFKCSRTNWQATEQSYCDDITIVLCDLQ